MFKLPKAPRCQEYKREEIEDSYQFLEFYRSSILPHLLAQLVEVFYHNYAFWELYLRKLNIIIIFASISF